MNNIYQNFKVKVNNSLQKKHINYQKKQLLID